MSINFTINGKLYSVKLNDHPPDITLNTFLRNNAKLTGTKFMCLEGGCGACIVTIRGKHPVTNKYHGWAANSCITLLNICDGWDIITIEGLGNKLAGYHPIQERLASTGGSQCGYCSPGMVMNMYSLLEAKGDNLTLSDIENSFGGNLCRCTGYRPILDAMKSFAKDSEFEYVDLCQDIEDLGKRCPRIGKIHPEVCPSAGKTAFYDDGYIWHYPKNLHDLFSAIKTVGDREYMLVAGNTAHGVFRRSKSIRTFIDVNQVPELHTHTINANSLEFGGNSSITEFMDILNDATKQNGFEYCSKIVAHMDKVGNVPVRNMGTIAGNLILKHQNHGFHSDIFLVLTVIGAKICVAKDITNNVVLTPTDFLSYFIEKSIITKVILPSINPDGLFFESYKIAPRSQNAAAYVNAAFLIQVSEMRIINATLCFGGINPTFLEATTASRYLLGKTWFGDEILRQTIVILSMEINPDSSLLSASPAYRKRLACGLFYKFILKNAPSNIIPSVFQSGGSLISRPISFGTQVFETNKDKWPITKPIAKLSAINQCAGEAVYMNDLPPLPGQVWASFVHALETGATMVKIDPSEALKIPGVVAFYSAKDIPGRNSFVTVGHFAIVEDEEIFCASRVKYHSQPVGVIVAETLELARDAAEKVKIIYERNSAPIICTMQDYLKLKRSTEMNELQEACWSVVSSSLNQGLNVKGHFEMGGQYHMTMETQTAICVPTENEITVYSANHFVDLVHSAMADALNIKQSKINIVVRRLGGSYGAKLSRGGHVATACGIAAMKLNRPVRFVQSLESNMATVGKRNGCICDYDVNVDSKGIIQNLSIKFYEDLGHCRNDNPVNINTLEFLPNCYNNAGWNIIGEPIITDAASHTWCRAPGSLEGVAMSENIMEHIARMVNRDPIDVRMDNIPSNSKMRSLIPEFLDLTRYRDRKNDINKFNDQNRWRKKGIGISLMRYPVDYGGSYPATVVVYRHDGSVAISHGGIEVGQGINTKVAQVAASIFGIDITMVTVKPSDSFSGANSSTTGGSITSEAVCCAVKDACDQLLERMKVARQQLNNPSWLDVVKKSYELNINLISSHMFKGGDLKGYDVWGLSCTEVEIDLLTGNVQLSRVDIVEDTGESFSPLLDVGQIEGAFIMGVGYWLTESLTYDRRNGQLLTNRTWNYKVPGAKDIPVDFRIKLYQKDPSPTGFMRSKATGEPGICLSVGVTFAVRHALDSARSHSNLETWYPLGAPSTPEHILLTAGHDEKQFLLQ